MSQKGPDEKRTGRGHTQHDGSQQQVCADLATWSLSDRPRGASNAS